MKRSVVIAAITVLVAGLGMLLTDGWVYVMSWLIAVPVIVTIVRNRRWTMNVSRWAKANAFKAQLLITALQLILVVLAIVAGYNFKQLGYRFSATTPFVFSAILVVGFVYVPFLPKRRMISIPKVVNKQRFAFLGIVLSSFVLMVVYGNRLDEENPGVIAHTFIRIDHALFPSNNTLHTTPNDNVMQPATPESIDWAASNKASSAFIFASFSSKTKPSASEEKTSRLEKKQLKMMKRLLKHRLGFAAALSAGAVLLFILLIFTSCAGICLLIGGFAALGGSGSAAGAIAAIALGALVTVGSALGIREIFRNKEKR